MRQMRLFRTAEDLISENDELRRLVAELAALVLDAEERSLCARMAPFEGRSLVVHERTWARLRTRAVRALRRARPTRSGPLA